MSEVQRNTGKYERRYFITSESNKLSKGIQLVGDVHGRFNELKSIIDVSSRLTIQLGDLGIGFLRGKKGLTNFKYNSDKFLFLRGNHDNPDVCRNHRNYLGEFGMYQGIFYISGAWSIDWQWRTMGIDIWKDEELSIQQLQSAIDLFAKKKPDIVVSHDCPNMVVKQLHPIDPIKTRTGQAMDTMMDAHKPSLWVFAHYHYSWNRKILGTDFTALDELETLEI